MRTSGGFTAQCIDCNMTQEFLTDKQRHAWIMKHHIGHLYYTWRRGGRK